MRHTAEWLALALLAIALHFVDMFVEVLGAGKYVMHACFTPGRETEAGDLLLWLMQRVCVLDL